MQKEYDYLIVGAGLYGATFAYKAHQQGKRCLVIDRRAHTGGNTYCEETEGIHVHKYGPHIFHTSDKEVWDFVNSFVPFNHYVNSPLANYKGQIFNLPFNMNTFHQMWGVNTPSEAQAIIDAQRAEVLETMKRLGHLEPMNLEEQALMLVGKDIYTTLVKDYTEKQWGRPCHQLPAFIIKRLPVRFTFDNNYFNDIYQGIPIGGYNKLIDGLLYGIEVRLCADFFDDRSYWESLAHTIVYTGRLDEFFYECIGKLDYRTVRFTQQTLNTANYQGNAVVNYTDAETPYTRIIEHKHFEMFGQEIYQNPQTIVSYEFPTEWSEGAEPFYPINDEANHKRATQYQAMASAQGNVIFGGRLAEYKYYDMAPIVKKALHTHVK